MESKQTAYIFIDEMKNGSMPIEVECNNDYYVFAAVVISEEDLSSMREVHQAILANNFHQSEFLKASKIKKKTVWIDIANRLKSVRHYVSYLAVDTSKLIGDGLLDNSWSFVKYFQNILNRRFLDIFDEVHVVFDETGTRSFQQSLKAYMSDKGYGTDLFRTNTFDTKEDRYEEPLLQVADFYAGAVGRYYRNAQCDIDMPEVYNAIRDRLIPLHFPYDNITLHIAEGLSIEEFNQDIFAVGTWSAKEYLGKNKGGEVEREIVAYLLGEAYKSPKKFVSSKELSRVIKLKYNQNINPILMIGDIRDAQVIIVSQKKSRSSGYKLPCNEAEIQGFYDSFTLNVIPMLKRVGIMNDIILAKTKDHLNILSIDKYSHLQVLVDEVRKIKIQYEDGAIYIPTKN